MVGEYCSHGSACSKGSSATPSEANIRVRRYGGRNIPYAEAAEWGRYAGKDVSGPPARAAISSLPAGFAVAGGALGGVRFFPLRDG